MSANETKIYDLIIPIGRSCHTAMMLGKLALRKVSLPFDWLKPSQINMEVFETRINLILNNFKNFFNYEDLEVFGAVDHIRVKNNYTGLAFYHDFPLNIPIDKSFGEISKKYKKRTKRLIKLIKKSNKILFVYMQNTWDQMDFTNTTLQPELLKLCHYKLSKAYPNKQIDFIIFENDASLDYLEINKVIITENITKFISNHTYTESDEQLSPILSIKEVLKNYQTTDCEKSIKKLFKAINYYFH